MLKQLIGAAFMLVVLTAPPPASAANVPDDQKWHVGETFSPPLAFGCDTREQYADVAVLFEFGRAGGMPFAAFFKAVNTAPGCIAVQNEPVKFLGIVQPRAPAIEGSADVLVLFEIRGKRKFMSIDPDYIADPADNPVNYRILNRA